MYVINNWRKKMRFETWNKVLKNFGDKICWKFFMRSIDKEKNSSGLKDMVKDSFRKSMIIHTWFFRKQRLGPNKHNIILQIDKICHSFLIRWEIRFIFFLFPWKHLYNFRWNQRKRWAYWWINIHLLSIEFHDAYR